MTPPTAFDWAARYAARNTPWDVGSAHPELVARIAAGALAPPRLGARAFVPGCGRGHDALALAKAGWCVTAIDLVDALAASLAPALTRYGGELSIADALEHEPREPYELLFDHTFFCALDPADRPRFGALAERVLAPGARLVSLVFPVGRPAELGGPPFGMAIDDLDRALGVEPAGPGGAVFERLEGAPVRHRAPGRRWDEHVAVFERSSAARQSSLPSARN